MIENMDRKIALITGGSSSIGRAITLALEKKGWEVLNPAHKELNLSDLEAVSTYAESIKLEKSKIDALIHVAGIWHDSNQALADMPMGSFSTNQVVETMNVGVTAAMVLVNSLLPIMEHGTFIGVSGTFSDGAKGWLPYYVSKRALEDFILGLSEDAPELKAYGISPADTATDAFQKFYPDYVASAQPPEAVSELAMKLLEGQENYENGSIIKLRNGNASRSFHS